MRRAAFISALSARVADGALYVLESLDLPNGKTKTMAAVLNNMGLSGSKALVVLDAPNPTAMQAGANLPRVSLQLLEQTSVVDLLKHDKIVLTRATVEEIERRFSH